MDGSLSRRADGRGSRAGRRAAAERFQVIDTAGRGLTLAGSAHWKLFASSGGQPVDLFGEWDGRALLPLGILAEGTFHTLVTEAPA